MSKLIMENKELKAVATNFQQVADSLSLQLNELQTEGIHHTSLLGRLGVVLAHLPSWNCSELPINQQYQESIHHKMTKGKDRIFTCFRSENLQDENDYLKMEVSRLKRENEAVASLAEQLGQLQTYSENLQDENDYLKMEVSRLKRENEAVASLAEQLGQLQTDFEPSAVHDIVGLDYPFAFQAVLKSIDPLTTSLQNL